MLLLNGKIVAEAVLKDIESFFFYSKLKIKIEFYSSGRHSISLKGQGKDTRITLSKDFCSFQINDLDDLFYIIIMICHEVAHYLNKHNNYEDSNNLDSIAIETWADFFGSRVFMSVITYGKRTQSLIRKFIDEIDQNIILQSIGRSILKIYNFIYLSAINSKYYPPPIERVSIFTSGVISFFYRIYGIQYPNFLVYVSITILRESGLATATAAHNINCTNISEILEILSNIHKTIQGVDIAITKYIKPKYGNLLDTNYNLSNFEVNHNRNKIQIVFKKLGWDINEFIKNQ